MVRPALVLRLGGAARAVSGLARMARRGRTNSLVAVGEVFMDPI
jgi:hypothetical protein